MENAIYYKAYTEVLEILKYVPQDSVNKIPKDMLEMFKIKYDKDYNFKIDTDKPFEEQELLDETKAIFANIFRDYWATPYQRERILAKEEYDRKILEEEKRQQYNPDDIFKNKSKVIIEENQKSSNLPVEVKKEKFYQRFINFIKKILKI